MINKFKAECNDLEFSNTKLKSALTISISENLSYRENIKA